MPKRWTISAGEAAELLGVHHDTVYLWLKEKRIPGRKIRGRWLIPRNDLLLFLAGRGPHYRHAEQAAD